jgi:hypothetical protein
MSPLVVTVVFRSLLIFLLNAALTLTPKTVRIEAIFDCTFCATGPSDCLMTHIKSEGLEKVVLAAVPLWNGQLDLVVEQASVEKVSDQLRNLTRYRLKAIDPLFLPQSGYSQEEAALRTLKEIRSQYEQQCCTTITDKSNNRTRVEQWFATQMEEHLIKESRILRDL